MSADPGWDPIVGFGLELRPWETALARQVANWGVRGFPYHAFDMAGLRERGEIARTLLRLRQTASQRHIIACEGGFAVGRVSVNLEDTAGLYLWSVHVPPEHEGRAVCRRMLAALMTWMEANLPNRDFVLISNSFATHAHRAYEALGFRITETRWQFDRDVSNVLWREPERRGELATHVRFSNGRWETRGYLFRRKPGAPMVTALTARVTIG